MLIEQQITERRERALGAIAKILKRPTGEPFGDYSVKSASGKTYRLAMRVPGPFENYCSCPDFRVNTLGTCKHIESLLLRLRRRHGAALERKGYARTRSSISLQYGETIEIRLRMPAYPPPALRSIAEEHFDGAGLLRREHFPSFHRVLEVFRNADQDAVIYSDVLEYVDRENEITEGLELERQLLGKLRRGQDPLNGVLKTKLLPYQTQGAIFAASRGRVVLADDMGLGKTVQALAAAELLRRRRGIARVLVVAPASVIGPEDWRSEEPFARAGSPTPNRSQGERTAIQSGVPMASGLLSSRIKAINDAGAAAGASGLNLSLDAQLVADIKSIAPAVKGAAPVATAK
jgi:SNF2-related domain